MAMTLQQLQEAINNGSYTLKSGVGPGLAGFGDGSNTFAYYPTTIPGQMPGEINPGYVVQQAMTPGADEFTAPTYGNISQMREILPWNEFAGDPNWSASGNFGEFLGMMALGAGGLGAMGYGLNGLGGAAGLGGVGSINPSLASSFAEMYSPAAWSAPAGAAGSTAGGNMFKLGDLTNAWSNAFGEGGGWNPLTDGYGMGDAVSSVAGYGQNMATAAELAQMQAQYPDWYNALTGVTDIGISPSNIWSAFKAATGSGSGGGTDWLKTLGSLGAAGLGAYASNKQTNALEAQAQRYEGYGAPYRQKLSELYKDPTSFLSSPEVRVPVDQGTSSLMRSLSTQGNPFGSGNALQQGQSYASDQLFGKLGQEKDRLAGFGGLSSYNQAAPQASTNAINSSSNAWNAVGAGANNIFNPPQTQAQTMAEWAKAMRGGV
jgi:hypothetical protein